jgi:UDP-N-acetylmuramate dehydrogenase
MLTVMTDRERFVALETELTDLGLSVRWDEPMSAHTTYQIGGPADMFVIAGSEQELIVAVQRARAHGVLPFLMGGGANLLVADAGIRGVVIQYQGSKHAFWEETGEVLLWTEAGAQIKDLSRESMSRGLEGLEWAVDVPGTVGGAIVGNAGAYGGYICDSLLSVKTLEPDGTVHELQNVECGFCYRGSIFKQQPRAERSIVLSATLVLHPGNGIEIAGRAAQYSEYRFQRHPREPSCGSVFKRTANYPAGFLIEQSGLKGTQQGKAMISPQHANYIINLGGARATDVKALIELAQEQVKTQFGEELELEVELVGEW